MEWQQRLADLLAGAHTTTADPLDAGACLSVTDAEGREVFHAPLARHHRIDDDDPNLLWIRPIHPGTPDPSTGERVYNLSLCRRRALHWDTIDVTTQDEVHMSLTNGQRARIAPASGNDLDELHAWDVFTLTALTSAEETELDALRGDSWTARYS